MEEETFEPIFKNKKREQQNQNQDSKAQKDLQLKEADNISTSTSTKTIRSSHVIKGTKKVVDDKPKAKQSSVNHSTSNLPSATTAVESKKIANTNLLPQADQSYFESKDFSLKTEDEKDLGDLLVKNKEDARNELIEKLQTEQTQLEIYITTLIGLIPTMGTKNSDNRKTRRAIEQVREKSKQTAKIIHEHMDVMLKDWIDRKDDDESTTKFMKQQYRAFQEQYTGLLAKLQIVFQEIQDRETAFPFSKLPVEISQHSDESSLQQTQTQVHKGGIVLSNEEFLEPIYFDDNVQDLEDELQIEVIEQDINELLEIFQTLTDSVQEQEEQLKRAEQQITEAHKTVSQSAKNVQKAKKYALIGLGVVGAVATTLIGAGIGALVAGPVGVAASLPASASVAAGLAVGAGIGLTGGVVGSAVTSKLVQRIHGLKKKTSAELDASSTSSKK